MGVLYGFTYTVYLPIITLLLFFIIPRYLILISFILGLLFTYIHQHLVAPQNMPDTAVLPIAQISGRIVSIPSQTANKTQFIFAIEQLNQNPVHALVLLNWYNNRLPVQAGQHWHFSVKLKKPRNFQNPGSFDYAAALAAKHIYWTGYILAKNNYPLKQTKFDWLSLREHLANQLYKLAPDEPTSGILEALTLNTTTHISQQQWDLFRRTGTTHLFGISGEHIALISGLIFALFHWLMTRCPSCCLRIPAVFIASAASVTAAFLYAFLAGFEPPVQRALIGCIFYSLYCLGRQRFSSWQIWRYALFAVVCIEPHAVFKQGFYFSFLAVACLLLTQQRWRLKGYKATLALQASCLLGLMPLTLYWYSYGSINGFLANLFAIPLVGLLIVPLALLLLCLCHYSWSWLLMKPLSMLVILLNKGLLLVEHLSMVNFTWPLTSIECACALMASLLMGLTLPTKPFKTIALLWLLIPFIPHRPLLKSGEARIHVLDVGQGLAVSIQTTNHVLLYDTGDSFFSGSDLGKLVVVPYFTALGIKKIDRLVISHPDKDHRGGFPSIEKEVPIKQLLVNDPNYYKRGFNCHNQPQWQWDGVQFRFFPIKISAKDRNNSCCVLQIKTSQGSLLLPGDIERKAENYLIKQYGAQLKSQVLILPHHGSKTSSSIEFLKTVAPQYAIASLGFDNRFGFPHQQTVSSLKNLAIDFYRTDESGMIGVLLNGDGVVINP